jgi:hypothetical protein
LKLVQLFAFHLIGERFAVLWQVEHLKNYPKIFLSLNPIELVNIGRAIERDIQAESKERQIKGSKKGSGKLPEANESAGDTRDQVAKLLGTCGLFYQQHRPYPGTGTH